MFRLRISSLKYILLFYLIVCMRGHASQSIARLSEEPDFPTGALILGKAGMRDAYRTGTGKVKVRSVCEIEETSHGKMQIVVTEIPYAVNKARLIEKMAELVKDK